MKSIKMGQIGKKLIISLSFSPNNYNITYERQESIMIDGGLVVQGGGTRGAFAAGALDVLSEKGLIFSKVYGTSAGALCLINYISEDIGRSHYVVTELMRDKRFVSVRNFLLTRNLFNFKYLFYTIPKTKCPFNEEAFFSSPIEFYSCATCLQTGHEEYLPKVADKKTTYRSVAASASLPLYSRPIKIGNKQYLDGGQVAPVPYKKPLNDGVEKIVIILTRELGFIQPKVKEKTARKALRRYKGHEEFIKTYINGASYFNDGMKEIREFEEQGRVFVIRPDIPPKVGIAETNKAKLEELYQQGRQAALDRLEALEKYLSK